MKENWHHLVSCLSLTARIQSFFLVLQSHCVEILKEKETVSDLVAQNTQNNKQDLFWMVFHFLCYLFLNSVLAESAVFSTKPLGSSISSGEG